MHSILKHLRLARTEYRYKTKMLKLDVERMEKVRNIYAYDCFIEFMSICDLKQTGGRT